LLFLFHSRLSQVTREGKYVHSDVPKQLLYGTMVFVRQTIVADASKALSRAVCIAVRYSAIRKQFGSQDGGPETKVFYIYNTELRASCIAIYPSSL
jgi:acyl-CoA oxidase